MKKRVLTLAENTALIFPVYRFQYAYSIEKLTVRQGGSLCNCYSCGGFNTPTLASGLLISAVSQKEVYKPLSNRRKQCPVKQSFPPGNALIG